MNTYVVIPAEVLTPADTYANLDTKGIQILHPTTIFSVRKSWLHYGC